MRGDAFGSRGSPVIVYVARHGETDWNREGRYQGQRESQLTELGSAQAKALALALASQPIERVVSSPLERCIATTRPLAHARGLDIATDERLIEISHGTWEGRLRTEIERDDPVTMLRWRNEPERVRFDGGESLRDVQTRFLAFVAELDERNDETVILTHDVLVRCAILSATDRPLARFWEPRVVNGGYARFAVADGRWRLLDECIDAHLGDLIVESAGQAL